MKAVLVDDEPHALTFLENQLLGVGEVEIAGSFTSASTALEWVLSTPPDLLFLDIEIANVNGMELAETVLSKHPDIQIVFVTAYQEYAVKAFELNAVDYIMKPISKNRLKKTLERLQTKKQQESVPAEKTTICCLPSLQFFSGEKPIHIHWRTSKAKGLFLFLLHHLGHHVRKDVIIETFWPDSDYKKAYAQLYSTVYLIRKTLTSVFPSIRIDNFEQSYTLEVGDIHIDYLAWEKKWSQLPALSDSTLSDYLTLLDEYRGDYLREEDYLWAENKREHLKNLWRETATAVANYLFERGQYEQAARLGQKIQEMYPFLEESYCMLMKIYAALNEPFYFENQYNKLVHMLDEEFAIDPSPELIKLRDECRKQLNE